MEFTGSKTTGWHWRWPLWLPVVLTAPVAVAVAAVLFWFDPARTPIYPVCLFHQLTGLDCPGCGGLRAMHQLLHGHVVAALHDNAMLVCSLPLPAVVALRLWNRRIAGLPGWGIGIQWIWIYVGMWLAFGVLRNLPVPWLAAFAP